MTEATVGLDLVRLQLEIAAGQPLSIAQAEVEARGHAIEARLYAEDAAHHFLPSTGPLHAFVPPQGPGIRNDVGVEAGDSITMYYDPMIAKLIVHAESRSQAVRRLCDALDRYVCLGPTTNLRFLQWIAARPEFATGEVDIGFVEREWRAEGAPAPPWQALIGAALADMSNAGQNADPWKAKSGWRTSGVPRRFQYQVDEHLWDVEFTSRGGDSWLAATQDIEAPISLVEIRSNLVIFQAGDSTLQVDAVRRPDGYSIVYQGIAYELLRPRRSDSGSAGHALHAVGSNLSAPMPGTIVSIGVVAGQSVDSGEPLVIMEAMKMEHVVEAVSAGTVKAILVQPGEMVAAGTVLVQMDA